LDAFIIYFTKIFYYIVVLTYKDVFLELE